MQATVFSAESIKQFKLSHLLKHIKFRLNVVQKIIAHLMPFCDRLHHLRQIARQLARWLLVGQLHEVTVAGPHSIAALVFCGHTSTHQFLLGSAGVQDLAAPVARHVHFLDVPGVVLLALGQVLLFLELLHLELFLFASLVANVTVEARFEADNIFDFGHVVQLIPPLLLLVFPDDFFVAEGVLLHLKLSVFDHFVNLIVRLLLRFEISIWLDKSVVDVVRERTVLRTCNFLGAVYHQAD